MDWRPLLIGTGGVAAFVAVALGGALVIVALAPADEPVAAVGKVILMESAAPLPALDEPARSRQSAALTSAETVAPSAATPSPNLSDEPSDHPQSKSASPSVASPVPMAAAPRRSGQREESRPLLAALPPQASLETRLPPSAPAPIIRPRPEPPQPEGVLTPAVVRRLRLSLQLTREQELHWPAVEQALVEIGSQQAAMIKAGQDPKEALGISAAMRMYSLARPLLDSLREDQKGRIRALARSMGFTAVASQI